MGWSQDTTIVANATIIDGSAAELRGSISLSMPLRPDLAVVFIPCDGVENSSAYLLVPVAEEKLTISDNGDSVTLGFSVARSSLIAEKYALVVTFKGDNSEEVSVLVNWPSPTGLVVP